MRLLKLFLIRVMIIVFRGQMFHVTSFWKWPDRQSFLFFFAYSHISNPRDSTKPVSSTFKRYSFIAILFSCTGRIRSYFKRPVDSRNQKKKERKCIAQENCRLLSFVRWKVKERQRWNRETKEEKWETGNRHRFGRIFETIRVRQAKTRSTFFLLSATWTERAITLNSNFHVPFALLSASPLRGEKGGEERGGYTHSRQDSNPLPTACLLSTKNNQREFLPRLLSRLSRALIVSSTSNRIELTGKLFKLVRTFPCEADYIARPSASPLLLLDPRQLYEKNCCRLPRVN